MLIVASGQDVSGCMHYDVPGFEFTSSPVIDLRFGSRGSFVTSRESCIMFIWMTRAGLRSSCAGKWQTARLTRSHLPQSHLSLVIRRHTVWAESTMLILSRFDELGKSITPLLEFVISARPAPPQATLLCRPKNANRVAASSDIAET